MVLRILTGLYAIGEMDNPITGSLSNDVTSAANNQLARTLASKAIVLLKNNNTLLPLPKNLKKIAVFNQPADSRVITGGGGSGSVQPKYTISPLAGMKEALKGSATVFQYYNGNDVNMASTIARTADVAICVVATSSSEGGDRGGLSFPPEQVGVCTAVAQVQKTVVVMITPGAALVPFANVADALLVMFMPGQEEGNALADVLFGAVGPSGRLPVTFPNVDNEVGFKPDEYPGVNLVEYYHEQLNVGYRWYASHNVKPHFPFGFGLSYTNFSLSGLTVTGRDVSVDLKNTGSSAGAEVVQLYLGFPAAAGEPPIQLKGFEKVTLNPGAAQKVTFSLTDRDLSIWDVASHSWKVAPGTFTVNVGTSSQDLPLKQNLNFF